MPTLTSTTLGKFCREIAAQLSPLPVLLEEWDVGEVEFAQLIKSDGYKYEMGVIAREMQEMGADAGYVYRMKSLAEECIDDVVTLMKDPETPRSTRVELIKFVTEMARLKEKPPTPLSQQEQMRNNGPSVVFHFGAGLPVQTMKVLPEPIEVAPERESTEVIQERVRTLTQPRKGFGLELE